VNTGSSISGSAHRNETSFQPDIPKKLLICKYWLSGNCRYTSDRCPYAHTREGTYENVQKSVTCYFWWNGGTCRRTADECEFAHFDTGAYAGPPRTFRKVSMGANVTGARTPDPRLLQREASPSETTFAIADEPQIAESVSAISPEVRMTEAPESMMNGSSGGTFINGHTDPRRITRKPSVPQVKAISPSQPEPLTATSNTANGDDSGDFMLGSIEEDFVMAREGISKLDNSRLLTKEDEGLIRHVYIHMPPDRRGELDLLFKHFTRLHCQVWCSFDPAHWDLFRRSYKTGLLVFHPSESFCGTIPGLHEMLGRGGTGLRAFSIGVQHEQCILEDREPAYEARRIFPHGGITFITDDVFVYYPEKATEIIERFTEDAKRKPEGAELSKIGARPGVKGWLERLAIKKAEEAGTSSDTRWSECYEALCKLCPLEDEDPEYPDHSVPLETSYLWSIWEESLPSFKGRWESGDEEGATDYMANLFAGEACSKVWKYRKFLFVYKRPPEGKTVMSSQGFQEVQNEVDPKGWAKRYSHIGVMTPDQYLKSIKERKLK
jgi:hypothetical protein